jgi:hypothetical protein
MARSFRDNSGWEPTTVAVRVSKFTIRAKKGSGPSRVVADAIGRKFALTILFLVTRDHVMRKPSLLHGSADRNDMDKPGQGAVERRSFTGARIVPASGKFRNAPIDHRAVQVCEVMAAQVTDQVGCTELKGLSHLFHKPENIPCR